MPRKGGKKNIVASGKHDFARAQAIITEGNGTVLLNSVPFEIYQPEIAREKIREALILAGDIAKKVNIKVNMRGGGYMGQAMAARLAIARGLVKFSRSEKLKRTFLDYDRNLLVADVRRKETRKPGPSKARAAAQKSKR